MRGRDTERTTTSISGRRWVATLVAMTVAVPLTAMTPSAARAQGRPGGPPAVGVVKAQRKPVTETTEFVGRIEAIQRVAIVARVTAYLEKVAFRDGTEVRKGDLLYELERPPFQADLQAKQAVADQFAAQLVNAKLAEQRARSLLSSNAGAQATVDSTTASEKALAAQLLGAQASAAQSQINLDYTRIASPIDGQLGRTRITRGNVVSPSSGTLVTIVSQDPMYVTFPVAVRTLIQLRDKYIPKGGYKAVQIRVRLPNGHVYDQVGTLDFTDNSIQSTTDTLILRGTIPNPPLAVATDKIRARELVDQEFVTVLLQGVQPVEALSIPRSAVLMDQTGDYVWVVGKDNKAERRAVKLGQSTATEAAVLSGVKDGDIVVAEGVQRVRAGQAVAPGPMSPTMPVDADN